MKITVELKRAAPRRLSAQFTPLVARVVQDGSYGFNLLSDSRVTDVECAKGYVQAQLEGMFRRAVEIEWVEK